jgi:hypothetical protein
MRNSAERAKARVVAWNVYNAMADVGNNSSTGQEPA